MKGVILPCYFHTEETAKLEELELYEKIRNEDYDVRDIRFYQVAAIAPHGDGGTKVYLGETCFHCVYDFEKVEAIINNL